jgi:putative phage-type endonuclease
VTNRETWLKERMSGIGGSDAPAVLGLSKWQTPLDVFYNKRGEGAEYIDNEPMKWGRLLEPVVRQEYAERRGEVVRVSPHEIVRHPVHSFMFCTPDGKTDSGRLYEGKTARTAEGWGEEGSADIPEMHLIQVQHSLVVTTLPVCDVAVLIAGSDFRIYEVPADDEMQELIVEVEAEFWGRVQRGEPPAPRTVADAQRRFRSVRPGESVTATQEIERIVADLMRMKIAAAELEAMQDAHKALVMGYLGDAELLVNLQGKPLCTWKQAKGAVRFDTATFKAESPDLYAQYLKEGEATRRFLLK